MGLLMPQGHDLPLSYHWVGDKRMTYLTLLFSRLILDNHGRFVSTKEIVQGD